MANLKTTIIDGALTEKEGTATWPNGTTLAVDLVTGSFFEVDFQNASGVITSFQINNPHATQVSEFKIKISQGSPSRDFSWAALSTIKWPGGGAGAPTMTGTNNAVDIYSFTTYDNGTTWFGKIVGQNFS